MLASRGRVRTAQDFDRLPLSWAQPKRNGVRPATPFALPKRPTLPHFQILGFLKAKPRPTTMQNPRPKPHEKCVTLLGRIRDPPEPVTDGS